jgi:hypothetical protein
MGTGIVSVLLHTLSTMYPTYHNALATLSIVFFVLNILHTLPSNVDAHATPPSPVAVPRYIAYGLCDDREHVCGSLRAGMGRKHGICSVGDVVG